MHFPKSNFPQNWQSFVDQWKIKKPLQARKLEEAHPLIFSEKRILLAVDEQSIVGPVLLQKDTQSRLSQQLHEIFGFTGKLEVITKSNASKKNNQTHSVLPQNKTVPESIVEQKETKNKIKQKQQLDFAKKHIITQEVIKQLDGKLINIQTST